MEYNLPDRILRELFSFAQEHSIAKIILFGSRARGTNTERSDIDIAVYGGDFDGFYWDVKENTHSLLMFDIVQADDIYRTGIIGQFDLTFELAWKALQEGMRKHSVDEAENGWV